MHENHSTSKWNVSYNCYCTQVHGTVVPAVRTEQLRLVRGVLGSPCLVLPGGAARRARGVRSWPARGHVHHTAGVSNRWRSATDAPLLLSKEKTLTCVEIRSCLLLEHQVLTFF